MKQVWQLFFPILGLMILALVWSTPITNSGGWQQFWDGSDAALLTYRIFQLLGLTAFTLITFQIILGAGMQLWERLYGPRFWIFHRYEGIFALLLALLHPLVLGRSLTLQGSSISQFIGSHPQFNFILLGELGLFLLLVTVSTAYLALVLKQPSMKRVWHTLHLANYIIFALIWIHSWNVGSDPRTGLLPTIYWIFAGLVVLAFLYRRVYRPVKEGHLGLD